MVSSRPEMRTAVAMQVQPEPAAKSRSTNGPFHILVLGDFSGRGSRGLSEPEAVGKRRPVMVDRDNFDEVLAGVAPVLRLPLHLPLGAAGAHEIAFRELDDFHPDALFRRVELFDRLRGLRTRLRDPKTAAAAIAEMTGAGSQTPEPAPSPPQAEPEDGASAASPTDASDLLESAMQATEADDASGRPRSELVERLVHELVTPYSIPRPDARVADLVTDVEHAMAGQMRALLGAPPMQQLEAAWRSLYRMIRQIETDGQLKIFVLDVTAAELRIASGEGDPLRSGLARVLVDGTVGTPGGVAYAVVVSDLTIGANVEDIALADRIATICAAAGSAFVCAAAPQWVGCQTFAGHADPDDWNEAPDAEAMSAWSELREQPRAAFLGMVMPRFLVRAPYGARSSPVSGLPFEEETEDRHHEALLWGNGAFLVAMLLAETWRQQGWQMTLLASDEIDGIPLHVRLVDGYKEAVPGAEIELTSRGGERIGALGFMPLFSVRGSDAVRLGALRSISTKSPALAGRWGAR